MLRLITVKTAVRKPDTSSKSSHVLRNSYPAERADANLGTKRASKFGVGLRARYFLGVDTRLKTSTLVEISVNRGPRVKPSSLKVPAISLADATCK